MTTVARSAYKDSMYESRTQKPLPRPALAIRLLSHMAAGLGLLVVSLTAGMLGYIEFVNLSVIAAFLNTAMLLGGMGPVNMPTTASGKLFAEIYALYAGLVFIATVGPLDSSSLVAFLDTLDFVQI